jgi:hypothetical protein
MPILCFLQTVATAQVTLAKFEYRFAAWFVFTSSHTTAGLWNKGAAISLGLNPDKNGQPSPSPDAKREHPKMSWGVEDLVNKAVHFCLLFMKPTSHSDEGCPILSDFLEPPRPERRG